MGARHWLFTDCCPPNHREVIHVRGFNPDSFEDGGAAMLHAALDEMIAEARQELAKLPDANVWRLGSLMLRWRVGQADGPMDFAMMATERTDEHVPSEDVMTFEGTV